MRLDINLLEPEWATDIRRRLFRIEASLGVLVRKEEATMALGEDILAKVREADGKVDSVVELVKALRDAGTIPPDVAAAIFSTIQGSEDKLDAAIGPRVTA